MAMPTASLQLWGGVECTVNRVSDQYHDQLELSGHGARLSDLNLFAELGISALRYPILWERIRPDDSAVGDWQWANERLDRLRELSIRPIVGLTHHGSGPPHTSLVSPSFIHGLASFAGEVAKRFPWVDCYTPVNEPLTTARFSGLYGHWYPHGTDALTFARALLTECRAVVESMRAIRRINSHAKLIQTEDLGRMQSTPALAYQAEFENERRWLTYDLLCGRLDRAHAMFPYLRWVGVGEDDLLWFRDNPCPPDIIGINHYVTSDRFLDERIDRYPLNTHGGNGRHVYADVEAVRVDEVEACGFAPLIAEAWARYQLPVAVTEVHLSCTREEQLRWFWQAWREANTCREAGVDVRAITAWSLLGAYDWNSLVTRRVGHYDPGVFDLRAGSGPRATALATLIRQLEAGESPLHPVISQPGWWKRPERALYPPFVEPADSPESETARTIVITGAAGKLAQAFGRICKQRGLPCRMLTRAELDIGDPVAVESVLSVLQPWAVINAAGYVRVDEAEDNPQRCRRENLWGPAILAEACARNGASFVTFSSNLVFDGRQSDLYTESDHVRPLNVYGQSKAEAERRVLELLPRALIVRTSAFFGPWDSSHFLASTLSALAAGQEVRAIDDVTVSPTYIPDLVHATLDLLIDGEIGVWHLSNEGALSWAELARRAAVFANLDPDAVRGCSARLFPLRAQRPAFSALGSERGRLLPAVEEALERYIGQRDRNQRGGAVNDLAAACSS